MSSIITNAHLKTAEADGQQAMFGREAEESRDSLLRCATASMLRLLSAQITQTRNAEQIEISAPTLAIISTEPWENLLLHEIELKGETIAHRHFNVKKRGTDAGVD